MLSGPRKPALTAYITDRRFVIVSGFVSQVRLYAVTVWFMYNYNTRLDSSVRIKTRICTEGT